MRFETMNDAEQIARITRYETLMQEAEELLQSEDNSAEAISWLWCLAQELDASYTSDEWKQDYVDDEAGLLPQDLKRGVLSEDGLYDLLEQIRDFRIEALLAQPYWVIDILPQQVPEGGVAFVTENGDLRRVRALVGNNECSYGWSKTRIRSATATDWRK